VKVCILTTSFPLYEGIAVGIHVIEQARHLVKLGVEVDVLAPHHQGAKEQEMIDGIQLHRFRYMWPEGLQTLCYGAGIPTNLKNSGWARLQLPIFLFFLLLNTLRYARQSDLIHAHWSLTGLVAVLAGKLLRKPVVLMMHGAELFVLKGNPLIKFILQQADYVLSNSSFTQSKILEVVTPRKYQIIAPGVDVNRFRPIEPSVFYQREPDIPKDRPLVFSLGKFIERKGFPYLLQAMAELSQEPAPFLMIGGRGPLKEKLQAQARSLGIAERVKFLDYIPDEAIPAYYSAADVFILPSVVDERHDTEGLGVVLLEAMACQTPCVASRVGGIPDAVTDGVTGFLIEPAKPEEIAHKVRQLLTDDDLRLQMGMQGRQMMQKAFSWQAKARSIKHVYEEILGASS
jgi:glycosyltransferase involved in cell wall biosynthesis